ncbi:MerR family transcriptional regulator [Streptomyces sp. NPDC012888]|uniref:DNA polymerase III subunit beta family protein n=1 Tax=Streptomyces sp. NPDC012888 TaxID=3364855 RepID=UPI00367EC8C3
MRSIGELARESGLGVSALRFYDRAGVLVPAWVDPVSGYRWYGPEQLEEARLLARLRSAGMPLADVRLTLAGWAGADTDLVGRLLTAHLRRLERGLDRARGEFSTVRSLLERREKPMTSLRTAHARASVPAAELAAALDSVRFAVGGDPELPVLRGVLFDFEDDALHLVATDRYRMALARVPTTGPAGPRAQAVVPAQIADAMRALLTGTDTVSLTVDGGRVALDTGEGETAGQCLDLDFPDYRRLVRLPAGRRAVVEVPAFRAAVLAGPEVSVLEVTAGGGVELGTDGVAVNREFLLEALGAGGAERVVLELGAATAPVGIRRIDTEHAYSLLMPIGPDA